MPAVVALRRVRYNAARQGDPEEIMFRKTASWAAVALGVGAAGCQANPPGQPLVLSQTPPTVRAAYADTYRGTVIQSITRVSRGGQDYYTFRYRAADGGEHDVEYNGAGNEIDRH